tara:strand:- start:2037 stop:2735 length:699 start_codon:yes stop_codon:yes gene_type:complete
MIREAAPMTKAARKADKESSASNNRLESILDAAARMFHEKGYAATSTQDIANEVGLLKGSIYYYINSKEDLLFRIIEESHEGALRAISTVSHLDVSPLAQAYSLVNTHVQVFHDDLVKHSVFFREFRSLSDDRKEIIRGAGHAYSLFLRSIIEKGQAGGQIDSELNARMATAGIVGMLNSMSFWYQEKGSWKPEEIGNQFGEQVILGLVSEGYLADSGGRTSLLEAIRGELG